MDHFVEFEDVCKYYQTGSVKIAAADHMNFYVDKGEFCIIVGPSGAGKTTLLNILGGMDSCAGKLFSRSPRPTLVRVWAGSRGSRQISLASSTFSNAVRFCTRL